MNDIKKQIQSADISEQAKKVYMLLLTIPKGKVTTYKAMGDALGSRAYRAIGRILGSNPWIPQVPCHRVVASTGHLNGYAKGVEKKAALLREEGIPIEHNRVLENYILRVLI